MFCLHFLELRNATRSHEPHCMAMLPATGPDLPPPKDFRKRRCTLEHLQLVKPQVDQTLSVLKA